MQAFSFRRTGIALRISFYTSTTVEREFDIHFYVLMMQSFQNLQVVKRQQVEEFAERLIFPISQAAVAVSEKSSLYINCFKCHKTHFQSIAS